MLSIRNRFVMSIVLVAALLRRIGLRPVHGGPDHRRRARRQRRRGPGRDRHDHQPGDEGRPDRRPRPPTEATPSASPPACTPWRRRSRVSARRPRRTSRSTRARPSPVDFALAGQARGRGHGHGHEARGDGAEHARSRSRRPTEADLRSRGVDDIEGVARERGRVQRAEPGPRPEPGRHARRLLRPDRARPAGRQGAGGRLPRRVGDLALAVHAGHRPVRRDPRRGAARARRARCSAPARCRARCATSATSPSSA